MEKREMLDQSIELLRLAVYAIQKEHKNYDLFLRNAGTLIREYNLLEGKGCERCGDDVIEDEAFCEDCKQEAKEFNQQ
jgi:hypothetical protein